MLGDIDDGHNFFASALSTNFVGDKSSNFFNVDHGAVVLVAVQVEVAHTDFAEITGMVLIHVDAVMMLTTGKTTTTGMLAMLSNATVTS